MEKERRNQGLKVQTGRKRTYLLIGIVVLLFLLGGVLFLVGSQLKKREPLQHEANAIAGAPAAEESYLYSEVDTDFGYRFGIAANLYQQEDGSLVVYFANPADSEAYLMCEVRETKTDKILYRSGLIYPDEYVEQLAAASKFANEDKDITLYIYAFEPDTLYSRGTTTMVSVLHKW